MLQVPENLEFSCDEGENRVQGGYYADVTEEARCQVDNHEKHDDDWSNDGSLGSRWVLKLTPVDDYNDLIHTRQGGYSTVCQFDFDIFGK